MKQKSLVVFFLKAGRRGSNLPGKNVVFNGEHTQGKAPSQNNPFMFKTFIFQALCLTLPLPFYKETQMRKKKNLLLLQGWDEELSAEYLEKNIHPEKSNVP